MWQARPWWPVAEAAARIGLSVVVLDPEIEAGDILYDGDSNHGTITVVAFPGCGWILTVAESEGEIDRDLIPHGD